MKYSRPGDINAFPPSLPHSRINNCSRRRRSTSSARPPASPMWRPSFVQKFRRKDCRNQSSSQAPPPPPTPAPQSDSAYYQNNTYHDEPPPFVPTRLLPSEGTPTQDVIPGGGAQIMALLGVRSESAADSSSSLQDAVSMGGPAGFDADARVSEQTRLSQPTDIGCYMSESSRDPAIRVNTKEQSPVVDDEDGEEILYRPARSIMVEDVLESQTKVQTEEPSNEQRMCSSSDVFSKISAMQESLNELLESHREMQKQMAADNTILIGKEGSRLEKSLGRTVLRSNHRKYSVPVFRGAASKWGEREKLHIVDILKRELPSIVENVVSKEFSSVRKEIIDEIIPVIQESICSAVSEFIPRIAGDRYGDSERAIKNKVEATAARQIQAQFLTTGREVLRQELSSTLQRRLDPRFRQWCKKMVETANIVLSKGMDEHTASAQNKFDSAHLPLAVILRDTVNYALEFLKSFSNELAERQEQVVNAMPTMRQGLVMPVGGDVGAKIELARLLSQGRFEEAFTMSLQRSDVSIVSWLCSQVDLKEICCTSPLVLSQCVLISLLQQLSCDMSNETIVKLGWMTDVAGVIDPADPVIAPHIRPILEGLKQVWIQQWSLPTTTQSEATSIRLILHVLNSLLMRQSDRS